MVTIGEAMRNIEDRSLLSIGEKMQGIREKYIMLSDDNGAWDQIEALVDFNQYNKETAEALEEQHVNIEFKN